MIMSSEPRWYVVQTYSGHENKVKRLIEVRITEGTSELPEEKEIQQVMVRSQAL